MNATTTAQPRKGTVRDSYGDPCTRASVDGWSYPLSARCDSCGANIVCADGSADWYHKGARLRFCEPER